jgi:hypothetical protein
MEAAGRLTVDLGRKPRSWVSEESSRNGEDLAIGVNAGGQRKWPGQGSRSAYRYRPARARPKREPLQVGRRLGTSEGNSVGGGAGTRRPRSSLQPFPWGGSAGRTSRSGRLKPECRKTSAGKRISETLRARACLAGITAPRLCRQAGKSLLPTVPAHVFPRPLRTERLPFRRDSPRIDLMEKPPEPSEAGSLEPVQATPEEAGSGEQAHQGA